MPIRVEKNVRHGGCSLPLNLQVDITMPKKKIKLKFEVVLGVTVILVTKFI